MVRVHQALQASHAMTVVVRVVGEGQSNLSRSASKPAIALSGGAIHTDRAIFIKVHKAEEFDQPDR